MPEPILIAIAAALAGKAASGLYDLVKRKLSHDPQALTELEAATKAPDDSQAVEAVARRLALTEDEDAGFRTALRAEWATLVSTQHAEQGGVNNQVLGNADKVIQARDIHGDISF